MIKLIFNVSGQVLKRIDEAKIVSDTIGQFEAVFTFDTWWDNYTPIVQFIKNGKAYDCLLANNRCTVPPEVMEKGGVFYVSVFATENANRKTANSVAINTEASGYNSDSSHSTAPTPTIIEQLLKKVDDIKSYIAEIPKITIDSELSAESKNPVQSKAVSEAIENSKPMLITFNNADFDSSDTQQAAAYINFALVEAHILLMASFDVNRLNFAIPEGAEFSVKNILVEGEPFALSILDGYIKNMDLFSEDQGEGWIIDGSNKLYMHDYNFETSTNAQTAYEDIQSSINITGFQLLVSNYNQITAQEVE